MCTLKAAGNMYVYEERRMQKDVNNKRGICCVPFTSALLKYRMKNKKGSPSVSFLVSSKKVVFSYIINHMSNEAPEGHHWSGVIG